MDKTKIIVVEDNIVYCEYVCNMLSREGYRNMKAYHLSTAKKHLQQATDNDIVVADLRLPDGSGIDLLCWMRKEGKMQPFIIMTDYAEVNTAVESMKLGSIDYIPKQLVEDKLVPLIRSILKERQAGQRRMPVFAREGSAFQKIMHRIRLVAATDMSVMIFGENGTGKEHIAHLLHDKSKRAGKPFVAVDCGSLSKELAPSAFFGHVKGAFTGADNAKKGYFHEAESGTLIGQAGLVKSTINGNEAVELGYILDNAYWHHGYGTEAAHACLEYAFGELALKTVCCSIRPENVASIRVTEKLGMTPCGKHTVIYNEKEMPHLIYELKTGN